MLRSDPATPAAQAARKALEREAEREAFRVAVETPCSQQSWTVLRKLLAIISDWREEHEELDIETEGEEGEAAEAVEGAGVVRTIDPAVLEANVVFASVSDYCRKRRNCWQSSNQMLP